jgi:hypothetical protein
MRHDPGLAASPPLRDILIVGGGDVLSFFVGLTKPMFGGSWPSFDVLVGLPRSAFAAYALLIGFVTTATYVLLCSHEAAFR